MGQVTIRLEAVAIDNDSLGAHLQTVKSTVHSKDAGVEDIDTVDFFGRNNAYRPSHSITLNLLAQCLSLLVGELLAVVEFVVMVIGRKDHGSGIDTAGKAATARLVTSRLYFIGIIMAFQHRSYTVLSAFQNICATRLTPATKASTSSLVLYRAKLARTVPSI